MEISFTCRAVGMRDGLKLKASEHFRGRTAVECEISSGAGQILALFPEEPITAQHGKLAYVYVIPNDETFLVCGYRLFSDI